LANDLFNLDLLFSGLLLHSLELRCVLPNIKIDVAAAKILREKEVFIKVIGWCQVFLGPLIDIICLLRNKLLKFFEIFTEGRVVKLSSFFAMYRVKQKVIHLLNHYHEALPNTERIIIVCLELTLCDFLQKQNCIMLRVDSFETFLL